MNKLQISIFAGILFLGAPAFSSAQLGTPLDPMERAIEHLEKAREALGEAQLQSNPQVQKAHEELTSALEAIHLAQQQPRGPSRQQQDPSLGAFPGFGDPFAGGGMAPWTWGSGGTDPFAEMRRLREEMDEMMNRNLGQRLGRGGSILPDMGATGPTADMDIQEEADKFIVTMDLPGVGKDDIKIEARENHLQISGTREESIEESNERDGFIRRERRVGTFSRVVPLPGLIDPGAMEASHENGVLTIMAPKKEVTEEESRIVIVK